jgi:hypothetical protein
VILPPPSSTAADASMFGAEAAQQHGYWVLNQWLTLWWCANVCLHCCTDDDEGGPRPPAGVGASGGDGDDVKGPHTNLAVRLSKRDPNKKWLLGERLSYVLLTGLYSE